jgi:outer membrane protein TolC
MVTHAGAAAEPAASAPQDPMDLGACIQMALTQSPYFTKSATEIEIRRLDESDSRWSFLPTVSLSTQIYVYQPQELDTKGYSIDIVTGQFNPLASHFSLQASKLLTRMAVLTHLQAIANGIHQLSQKLVQLDRRREMAALQGEVLGLARQKAAFVRQLQGMGKASSLELRAAEHQERAAQSQWAAMAEEGALAEEIRQFLGLPPEMPLRLNSSRARQQALFEFDPGAATLEQCLESALELKILRIREQVQEYSISQAYGRYLPTLFFGLRTPDPLSAANNRDLFFSVGINLPVWDGMQRLNNISRQKLVLRQYEAETAAKRGQLSTLWREVQEQRHKAEAALLLARSAEELAGLRETQIRIKYQANGHDLGTLLDERIAHAEARRQTATRALELDLICLHIRHLCGDLLKRYVNTLAWKE